MKYPNVNLSKEIHQRTKLRAATLEITMKQYVESLINKDLEEKHDHNRIEQLQKISK